MKNIENVRNYRAKNHRVDYYPEPDVWAIIEKYRVNRSLALTIDLLIRQAEKSLTGKPTQS